MNKKIGVIGVPGKWSSETLADAVKKVTGFRLLISMDEVSCDLDSKKVMYRGMDLTDLDAVLVKKLSADYEPEMLNRLEILKILETRNVKIYSKPETIGGLLNRLNCTTTLVIGKIPIPPTCVTEDPEQALDVVKKYETAVFKPLFTSKARGMKMISDTPSAEEEIRLFQENGNRIMYIQKFFPLPNRDLGIVFLGGRYLATYARVRQNDSWNTTTRSGGAYEKCEPDEALIKLAKRAQALFGLDFTCVDIAETSIGPVVFEVSAFGGFRGLQIAHNINAAELLVDHVLNNLSTP